MKKVKPTQKRRKGKTERVPYLFRGRYSGSREAFARAATAHAAALPQPNLAAVQRNK